MPRKPIDYKKAIIYKITNADESLIYVGSTTDYRNRKNSHKTNCNNENTKDYHYYVYQMIRENGGWNAFEIKPVKEFPCENKIQLVIEEERIRKELNANLNKYRAITTAEERVEDQYRNNKAYAETNKEVLAEKRKIYDEANKERIKESRKIYLEANKESTAKRRKAYYEAKKTQSNLM